MTSRPRPTVAKAPGGRLTQLRRFLTDPLGYIDEIREVGDLVFSPVVGKGAWYVFAPEHVDYILRNTANYAKNTRGYRATRLALGQGLVTSQGDLWRRQRRIINPAFRRATINKMSDVMVECAADLRKQWNGSVGRGSPRDVARDMTALTLRIACRTLFSTDVGGGHADRIGKATSHIVGQFVFHLSFPVPRPELLPTPGNLRFWLALRTLDRTVNAIVSERLASDEHPHDMLSLLLAAVDEETSEGMSREQLRDELVTMLSAGHETTANALGFTLHLLAQNPEVLARVHDELDSKLGGRLPTGEDVPELPYLTRVVREAMRLYPPVWTHARSVEKADEIAGQRIEPGQVMILPQWGIQRDARYWDDPLRFDPDRFLPERSEGRHKFSWFGFSGGQRKCIGDHFARIETVLVLATLLPGIQLWSVPDRPVLLDPGVTLGAKKGIWQRLSRA
jgi:cytochrome P450